MRKYGKINYLLSEEICAIWILFCFPSEKFFCKILKCHYMTLLKSKFTL